MRLRSVHLLLHSAACLCTSLALRAQQITQAEYFFDTDLGAGQNSSLAIVASDTVLFSGAVPVTGLAPGYHYLYVRTKDDNEQWSTTLVRRLYIRDESPLPSSNSPAPVVASEYHVFLDAGPGNGESVVIAAGDTVVVSDTISLSSLNEFGSIPLILRVRDGNGIWSATVDTAVVKGAALLLHTQQWPVVRAGIPQPYDISISNPGITAIHDVTLVVDLPYEGDIDLSIPDRVLGGMLSDAFPNLLPFQGHYLATVWFDSIAAQSSVSKTMLYSLPNSIIPHGMLDFRYQLFYEPYLGETSALGLVPSQTSLFLLATRCHYGLSQLDSTLYNIPDTAFLDSAINFISTQRSQLDSLSISSIMGLLFHQLYGLEAADSSMNIIQSTVADFFYADELTDSLVGVQNRSAFTSTGQLKPCTRNAWENCAADDPDPCNDCCADIAANSCLQGLNYGDPLDQLSNYDLSSMYCERRCSASDHHRHHGGLDLVMMTPDAEWNSQKKPVKAAFTGTLTTIGTNPSSLATGGLSVRLTCSADPSVSVVYRHLSHITRGTGSIAKGHEIGWVGNTGTSAYRSGQMNKGIHLHFELDLGNGDCNPTCLPGMNLGYNSFAYQFDCRWCDSDADKSFECGRSEGTTNGDPNGKYGPQGFAIGDWIRYDSTYQYTVLFENVDSATNSVQLVRVVDTLDLNVFNASTLRCNIVGLGPSFFPQPDTFALAIVDTLDTRAWNSLYTAYGFSFDTLSGAAEWVFQGLDPISLMPTTDPLAGILPPDTMPPMGTGLVSYTISLQSTVPHAAIVANEATIYFDTNDPITTPPWTNTVDLLAPVSWVDSMPEFTTDTSFIVSWSGTDSVQSGIEYFDIYYTVNNDTVFEPWLQVTSETSATFDGQLDSTYHFYSIAVDSVGNRELKEPLSEAHTTVTISTPVGSYNSPDMSLSLFPNPTTGAVTLRGRTESGCMLGLVIRNAVGQVLEQRSLNISPGLINEQLDLSRLAPGTYFTAISCNDAKLLERLIRIAE